MAIANQPGRRSYPARWRSLLTACLSQRLQIDDFERLSELAFREFPVPSRELVEDLLDTRASTNIFWDPLIPEYLDSLYRKRRVTLQDILRCLLRKSTVFRMKTEPSGDRDAKRTLKRKRRGSNYDTLVSDFRIIQNGLMALTSGFPPLTKSDAIETLLAIVEWMKIICAPHNDGQKEGQEGQPRQCTWIMSSPDGVSLVEALGILTAGLLTTQTTIDAVISPKSDGLRRKMGKALGPYILLCDQFSVPLRMRLEALQKEFNLFDRHKKPPQEGDMGAMNLSVLDFEANIIDSPPVNAKAGLYIYLNAMLVGRPLVDNSLLITFLKNRYGGNNIAIVEELITAAFDMLANAKSRNELLFLKKSFLINKVPSLLQQLATEAPHPVPMELCISHALSRVDSQAFPSLSASFVNKFHKSSPLSDVRQEFVFSCALHKLIPEASIEPLLGEIPMQSLPSGGQRTRADVTSQIIQYPERLEQFLKKIESMDGNPSVMTVALTDAIKHFCEHRDTMTLKIICNCLSKRPRILDVIMLFSQPSDFMPSLTKLINTWKWEDKGEKQQVYEEFSNIILFIMAFQCRFDLSLDDLGLDSAGSFLQTLITRGHVSSSLDDLDTKTKDKVGAWIRALFVSEGISDDSIPCCPQDYYSIIATVTSQSMAACERNRLAFETLKGGFDYLLEPFLLPSLLFALRWLEGHVLDYQGDITPSLRILEALVKPTAISGDAQETHQLILQIISKSFEDTLKIVWVKHPNQADTVGRILEVFKAHGSYQRSEAVHHSAFRTWLSNSAPGGIVSDVLSTFSSLVYWSTNPTISLTPFPYTHCQLLTALRTVGAVAVLQGLLKELQDQANNGSLDIALDVAASYVVAPTVETFARDRAINQHQQALNENGEAKEIPPQRAGSTLMSLRDALVCEHESLSSEKIKQDEFRAQLVVRLFRRVNALTMPPQPISQDIQVPDLDVTNILPGVAIDDSHTAGDTGMQGVQAIFEPVPGGGGAMPASGNDIGGLNTFDMLIDDSDFMLDNFFHS